MLGYFGSKSDDNDDAAPTTLDSGQALAPIVPRDKISRKGKPLTSIFALVIHKSLSDHLLRPPWLHFGVHLHPLEDM